MSTNDIAHLERVEQHLPSRTQTNRGHSRSIDPQSERTEHSEWKQEEQIRIHDTETIHFGYWDKSDRIVSATLLDHIQAAGYRVLHAGIATIPRSGVRRAWMECRKHSPDTPDENKRSAITISCDHCE